MNEVKKTKEKKQKRILLAINGLSYTGAPRAVLNMCIVLLKNDFYVEVWSWYSGLFEKEFKKIGVTPHIIHPKRFEDREIKKQIFSFDMIIAHTICTHEIVQLYQERIPIIWYIHESKALLENLLNNYERALTFKQANNIYVVSEYIQQYMREEFGLYAEVLHNYVEDQYTETVHQVKKKNNKKINFLALGSIVNNKAYDVFIHAYTRMDKEYQEKCELHFAGAAFDSMYCRELLLEIESYHNIHYDGEMTDREKLLKLIDKSDVIVVASRDESCSLVALEAGMMKKPIIVSENVGAKYMIDQENGWIVSTGSVEDLRKVYQDIIDNQEQLDEKGEKSRQHYLATSTLEIYENNLLMEIKRYMPTHKSLYAIQHATKKIKCLYNRKRAEYPFSTEYIKKNSAIIVYGAGISGREWYFYLKKIHSCKVKLWVDKNFKNMESPVVSPDEILHCKFDFILIAVNDETLYSEIKIDLINMGVPLEQIKWAKSIAVF